jgi:hypothetical protein
VESDLRRVSLKEFAEHGVIKDVIWRGVVALTISEKRYQQIKAAVERGRVERLAAEMVAIDGDHQPRFADVDDFLNFADAFATPSRTNPPWSRKRQLTGRVISCTRS